MAVTDTSAYVHVQARMSHLSHVSLQQLASLLLHLQDLHALPLCEVFVTVQPDLLCNCDLLAEVLWVARKLLNVLQHRYALRT